jgi:hypothetical protein
MTVQGFNARLFLERSHPPLLRYGVAGPGSLLLREETENYWPMVWCGGRMNAAEGGNLRMEIFAKGINFV